MADKLTAQQAQAVYDRGGNLLVSAAAGSGKTKVLVDRLLSYLTDPEKPANLDDFLIITYTKAAATELRGKIAAKLTERIAQEPENRHLQKQMQRLFLTKISTVHGFCGDILREYAYRLDIAADFRVADETECIQLRDQVLGELLDEAYIQGIGDEDFRTFIDTQGLGRDDRLVPYIIQRVYDSARCHLDPESWLDGCISEMDASQIEDVSQTLRGKYLVNDLKEYLICQVNAFQGFLKKMEMLEGLEKPCLNLRTTLVQLEALLAAETWDEIFSSRKIDYGRLVFPKKNPDPELTDQVKAVRNACKKGLEKKLSAFADPSEAILKDMEQTSAGTRALVTLVKRFSQAYDQAKRSRRCLDFGDLEHKTLDLLLGKLRSSPTGAATEIGRRYREIMVDEYQDSNGVQNAIFTALTMEKKNCFMVGDVKQSIYQFRLADPDIFLQKYRDYVPAEEALPGQGRKVLLSHNFRSGGEVIDGVNAVFRACMRPKVGGLFYGEAEALREGIPHAPMKEAGVELYALETQEDSYGEEGEFVADRIQTMLREGTLIRSGDGWKKAEPEDIVILLRSPGSAGGVFRRALEARGIRCATGGGTNLLQTEEVGTLRAFLQAILNPRQDIPLVAALASPIFGFTADELAEFRSEDKKSSIYDALLDSESRKAAETLRILWALREEARRSSLTVLLQTCFALTRLDSIYRAMPGGEAKIANLQTFYQLASDFEQGSLKDLSQFLEHVDSLEERGLITATGGTSGCVSIMSIHKSKGLEFPVVFLSNLSRKFNQENLRAQILCDKELGMGLAVADTVQRIRYPSIAKRAIAVKMAAESVSEEMRVLYVAMTRARDRLIMTYASESLQKDLQDLALRQDVDGGELLCREANCLGDWVLMAAMQRTEAGELHALGGRPGQTHSDGIPWKIRVASPQSAEAGESGIREEKASMPQGIVDKLGESLAFRYRYEPATQAPSKQTATGRKGRQKDEEAAEKAQTHRDAVRTWRIPSFAQQQTSGLTYGSAIHAALQYLRYENCGSLAETQREILRLVERGYLTEEQGGLVNCEKLTRFFLSELGRKLRLGTPYLREFKFSILDDGSAYGDGLEGERVLLQGVVDCALLEEDGITVIDFKTDRVTDKTISSARERYRPQIETYAEALSRIYEMPIKAKYLYFFHLDRLEQV